MLPLTGDCQEYHCHCGSITRMRIAPGDTHLFTVGEDGCLWIFEIREKGRLTKRFAPSLFAIHRTRADLLRLCREMLVPWAEEVLVAKSDVEEKNAMMTDLNNKVEELTLNNECQLKLREISYAERQRDLASKCNQELEASSCRSLILSQLCLAFSSNAIVLPLTQTRLATRC